MCLDDAVKHHIKMIRKSNLPAADKLSLQRYFRIISTPASELSYADLATARVMAGLSLRQAAKLLAITVQDLQAIESNKRASMPKDLLKIHRRMDEVYGLNRYARARAAKKKAAKCKCCPRGDEYNGFYSGTRIFTCPKNCSCHD